MTNQDQPDGRVVIVDPLRLPLNWMELLILTLAVWSAAQARLVEPTFSVEQLLGPVWAVVWTVILITGAAVVFAGLFWRGRSLTAVSLQQLGYAAFAITSLARGIALVGVGESHEAVPIVLFAVFSALQFVWLQRRVLRYAPRAQWCNARLWRRWWA